MASLSSTRVPPRVAPERRPGNPGAHAGSEAAGLSRLYDLLARLFAREVDLELYQQLRSLPVGVPGRSPELAWIEPELLALPPELAVEELAVEFCRLFVGPPAVCPPFASVHRGEALLGGRARTRLEGFLDRAGLDLAPSPALASPDHLAVYLAALARLHELPEDAGRGAALRQELLRGHLLPWAPAYLQGLARMARRALYATTAWLTAGLLDLEGDGDGV
jgi:TorA maturation chaperone TorD